MPYDVPEACQGRRSGDSYTLNSYIRYVLTRPTRMGLIVSFICKMEWTKH